MAAKGEGFDWTEASAWLLSVPVTRDSKSRRIARDYYNEQFRNEQATAKD
jgi:hypothetical protein